MIIIAAAAVVLLAAIYFGFVRSYLGARLSGPDVSTHFTPLVRHLLASQNHCYDNGSQYCERFIGSGGGKEFTVAYLFGGRYNHLGSTNPVYGCFNSRSFDYHLTLDSGDCRSRRLKPYVLGYTSKTDNFESSTELFRCFNDSANNYLVTDDKRECELAGHTDGIISLGWAAAAGHLPQRRLEGLCAAAKGIKTLAGEYDGYCRNLSVSNTPSPSPAPRTQSWQNPQNRFDVDNDTVIAPKDLLILVNYHNHSDLRNLMYDAKAAPPPYLDVNGDKEFDILDIQAESQCVIHQRGQNCNAF